MVSQPQLVIILTLTVIYNINGGRPHVTILSFKKGRTVGETLSAKDQDGPRVEPMTAHSSASTLSLRLWEP